MSVKLDLTVAAIAEDNGRFLFVQERASRRLVLNQPAGHVEPGESLVDAVVRETREGTGREFRPESVIGLYLWPGPSGRTVLRVAFAGHVSEQTPGSTLDRAIVRTLWLDRKEIAARAKEHRSPLLLLSVDDYLRGSRHSLELLKDAPFAALEVREVAG